MVNRITGILVGSVALAAIAAPALAQSEFPQTRQPAAYSADAYYAHQSAPPELAGGPAYAADPAHGGYDLQQAPDRYGASGDRGGRDESYRSQSYASSHASSGRVVEERHSATVTRTSYLTWSGKDSGGSREAYGYDGGAQRGYPVPAPPAEYMRGGAGTG